MLAPPDHISWEARVNALIDRYRAADADTRAALEPEARALMLQLSDIARWAGGKGRKL